MKIVEFGNKNLRIKTKSLNKNQILSEEIQNLISGMRELLKTKKLGVGLASPQVGHEWSLAIIEIQPSKHRLKVKTQSLVIINPKIIKTYGNKIQMYEGCISAGGTKSGLFAKVPRYKKIKLIYKDQKGVDGEGVFDGLTAHVIQHEVDHLNGILFVDKVKDTKPYITYKEYLKILKIENN